MLKALCAGRDMEKLAILVLLMTISFLSHSNEQEKFEDLVKSEKVGILDLTENEYKETEVRSYLKYTTIENDSVIVLGTRYHLDCSERKCVMKKGTEFSLNMHCDDGTILQTSINEMEFELVHDIYDGGDDYWELSKVNYKKAPKGSVCLLINGELSSSDNTKKSCDTCSEIMQPKSDFPEGVSQSCKQYDINVSGQNVIVRNYVFNGAPYFSDWSAITADKQCNYIVSSQIGFDSWP